MSLKKFSRARSAIPQFHAIRFIERLYSLASRLTLAGSSRSMVACFGALLISAFSASAYNGDGHAIVGEMAAKLIEGTPAEIQVKSLLDEHTMAEVSGWADETKDRQGRRHYSDDSELNKWADANNQEAEGTHIQNLHHYCDIPIQEDHYFETSAGAGPNDIVHAMRDCILILQGKEPSPVFAGTSKRVALILLIHYAGDIGQPMHVGCGFIGDKMQWVNPNQGEQGTNTLGGNLINYTESQEIHGFWDDAVVGYAMRLANYRKHPIEYAHVLALEAQTGKWPAPGGDVTTWPEKFASAMMPDAAKAFLGLTLSVQRTRTGKKDQAETYWLTLPITQKYRDQSGAITHQNLGKAGAHLAQILEAIWLKR